MTKEEAEKKYDHICYHCHHFFIALDDSQKCEIGFREKDPTDSCKRFELDYRLYDRNGYLEQKRKVKRTTHSVVRSVANKYWHKIEEEGLPVVEGWYLCLSQGRMLISYDCAFFNGSEFEWSDTDLSQFVIAWHKIKQYK